MSEHNPFAPKRIVHMSRPPNDPRLPMERLRRVDAPPVVLAEAQRRWESTPAEDRGQVLQAFETATDDELRHALPGMELATVAQLVYGEGWSDDGDLVDNGLASLDALEALHTVVEIEKAVGHDKAKALAAMGLELRRPVSDRRRTLLTAMEAVLRG